MAGADQDVAPGGRLGEADEALHGGRRLGPGDEEKAFDEGYLPAAPLAAVGSTPSTARARSARFSDSGTGVLPGVGIAQQAHRAQRIAGAADLDLGSAGQAGLPAARALRACGPGPSSSANRADHGFTICFHG